jgi:hypothetical protein
MFVIACLKLRRLTHAPPRGCCFPVASCRRLGCVCHFAYETPPPDICLARGCFIPACRLCSCRRSRYSCHCTH